MTCPEALELLLAADAAELEGTAATPLAEHVRRCARCATVAARLRADTAQLAIAVRADRARRASRRPRRAGWLGLGAAATAALVLLLWRREPAERAVPVAPPVTETAAVPAPVARSSAPRETAPPAPPPTARVAPRPVVTPTPVLPASVVAMRAVGTTPAASRPAPQAARVSRAEQAVPIALGAREARSLAPSSDAHTTVHPDAETGITVIWLN